MRRVKHERIGLTVIVAGIFCIVATAPASADRMTSTNYKIDTSVGAPFGGSQGSANYRMTTSGGEAIIGSAASSSYKLGQGYVAQLPQSIQLNLSTTSLSLGTINSGVSNTANLTSQILTDAPSYALAINQNSDLTSGANTIPAITGGTIASPSSWTEGTTKGLGLTLTSGPSIPIKWGTTGAYKYAAIPNSATTIYNRSGYSGGATDSVVMQARLDTATTQAVGSYSNTMTVTATLIP